MSGTARDPHADLRAEIIRLGPWALDVEVKPGVSTRVWHDAPHEASPESFGKVSFAAPHDDFVRKLRRLFPTGLEGRSVLDCACNCGAFLFWAKEVGAGTCFGFDVRQHWIDQARFLARHRLRAEDEVQFEVLDLYELGDLGPDQCDITIFSGIFYHLPDPLHGLKIAADLTRELIIVNTATKSGLPDGMLAVSEESKSSLLSGVYGLNWFPTGPEVIRRTLEWLGFSQTRVNWWLPEGGQEEGLGRMEVLGARDPGFFDAFDVTRRAT